MSYVALTKPNAGDATRKSLADGIIDNLADHESAISGMRAIGIKNGSFEINGDGNLEHPDGWEIHKYNGGAGGIVSSKATDTNYVAGGSNHGKSAFRFTHPGGGGNGGGYLEQEDFIEVSPNRELLLQWQHKVTVAGMQDKVEVRFFDAAQSFLSAVTVYNSTSNPTSWRVQSGTATVPANAVYAKIRFTGGDPATSTGGDSFWDDFLMLQNDSRAPKTIQFFTANGSITWPAWVTRARIRAWGGGGGGGGGEGGVSGGGAGGGAAYAEAVVTVTPTGVSTVTVGAGGAGGGANANGSNGGNSSVGSLITANGGTGGKRPADGGGGGAGGTTGSATVTIAGQTGQVAQASVNSYGGFAALGGCGGGIVRGAAMVPGAGGQGGAIAAAGSAGADGLVIIEY